MLLFKIALVAICSNLYEATTMPAAFSLQNSLVAYYAFTGNTLDSTKYHNDAVANRAQLTVDRFGKQDQAYHFNGISSYMKIKTSASLSLKKSFSIAAWIRPDNFENQGVIVWHGDLSSAKDPYLLYFTKLPNGKSLSLRKDVETGTTLNQVFIPSKLIPLGTWTHVTGVCDFDSKRMYLYINGKLSASKIFNKMEIKYPTHNFYTMIGCAEGVYGNESYYRGAIDELKIYNRALTNFEIKTLSRK